MLVQFRRKEKIMFGYILIENYVETGRMLDQMTFETGEAAVAWLEENAKGIWGLAQKIGEGEEWGGGGMWLFQHQKEDGVRVAVRRLDEREVAESAERVADIARMKGEKGHGRIVGDLRVGGKRVRFLEED